LTESPASTGVAELSPHDTEEDLDRIATGFAIGSLLFAAGTVAVWLDSRAVVANTIFLVGSVCFTAAAAIQLGVSERQVPAIGRHRLLNPEWLSSAVQLLGTLFFNVLTVRSVLVAAGSTRLNAQEVWHPDYVGSVLFLIASWLAWHPVGRRLRHGLVRGRSHWILLLNMIGSILFAVSAWGALPVGEDSINNVAAANWGNFLGALAFLAGALLLLPPRRPAPGSGGQPRPETEPTR